MRTALVNNILAAGHAVLACGGVVQSGRPMKQEPGTVRAAIAVMGPCDAKR